MAHNIVMPALEMAQETGKLLNWRKKEGETVSQGEPLLDIETDKAVVEIESPATGILAGVEAREGDVVPVGQTIAWIVQPGENLPVEMQRVDTGTRREQKESGASVAAKYSGESVTSEIRVSPKARRLAREHGVDLKRVRGSGSEGEILAEDILALAASPNANITEGISGEHEKISSVARLMAERTAQSWTSVPHFFLFREIDAGGMLLAREKFNAAPDNAQQARITYTDLLVSVMARVLLKHPRVNASWAGGEVHLHQQVNIGISIAVDQGVVNIVIPGADSKTIGDIAALRLELAERARSGRSRPADLRDATFTISNLGMYKVDAFTAIIPAPQAAILAVGQIVDRVAAVDGKPLVRPMMTVVLSCDHRVVDGARAAEFLNDLADAANEPEKRM